MLAFVREHEGVRTLAAFNMSLDSVEWQVPEGITLLEAPGVDAAALRDGRLHFPPHGAAYAALR